MIKNSKILDKLNQEIIKKESFSYSEALKIFEELHKEAVLLGAISKINMLDGIEVEIKIAKAIN